MQYYRYHTHFYASNHTHFYTDTQGLSDCKSWVLFKLIYECYLVR